MKITFTLIVLFFSVELIAQNKAGTLDKSFGVNGEVVTSFDSASVTVCKGLIQPDNKIIAVGQYESIPPAPPVAGFLATRYMPDGSIDSSFADDGSTIITNPNQVLILSSACLQNDGKILIVGVGENEDTFGVLIDTGIIVRLNVDGSIDASFGQNGFVYTANAGYDNIAVQPDGKIIVIGGNFVSRVLENGSTDLSFGINGYAYFTTADVFYTCKIQPDGKILVGGYYSCCLGSPDPFLLKRFEVNGSLDSSFGSAGTVVTQVDSYDSYIYDLALQSDGKIVALGPTNNYTATATARYNTDGSPDSTFANNGIFRDYFSGTFGLAASVVIQNDDKILLGGNAVENNKGDYGIERLTANGLIDSSFGVNGETTTDFADYSGSKIASLGLQTSGKIVAIGTSANTNDYNISLARYDNDLTQKQQIITKIKHWIQHHNGIEWDNTNNVSSYAVQRSADGVNWLTVYRSPFTAHNYNDPAPLNGTNYYRLQTTSTSNAVTNSNVIAISNDDNIKVSPNPAQNILHVQVLSSNQKTKLTVVDFNGNIAISQQLSANSNSYNLNIASLHAGNYILKIETNGEVVTKQFVKE